MVWAKYLRGASLRPESFRYYHYSNSNLIVSKTPMGDPTVVPPPKFISLYRYQPDAKPEIFGEMRYPERNPFCLHHIYWFENFEYKFVLWKTLLWILSWVLRLECLAVSVSLMCMHCVRLSLVAFNLFLTCEESWGLRPNHWKSNSLAQEVFVWFLLWALSWGVEWALGVLSHFKWFYGFQESLCFENDRNYGEWWNVGSFFSNFFWLMFPVLLYIIRVLEDVTPLFPLFDTGWLGHFRKTTKWIRTSMPRPTILTMATWPIATSCRYPLRNTKGPGAKQGNSEKED